MPLSTDQQAEIDQARGDAHADAAADRAGAGGDPVPGDPGARPWLRAGDRLHGRRCGVVQAARVSYGRGTKKVSEDRGLINYLMRHRHTTPFEMCEIKYHVKLPIFVARQWIRHRTANVNEYSARYSILDNEFYLPGPEHLAAQSKANRQGRAEVHHGQGGRARLLAAHEGRRAGLRALHGDAERGRGGRAARSRALRPGARARAHEPVARLLYAVVLEDEPAQSHALPVAARRRPRAVRDPRLCRRR